MNNDPDILVLGHHGTGAHIVRVHHIPAPGETVEAWDPMVIKDGGKGSHQAIVISRLGGSSAFIGKIASDEQSEVAKQWLVDEKVNIKHLLRSKEKYPSAGLTMIDDNGVNSIVSVPGVRKTLTFEEVKPGIEDFKSAKIFITGFEIPIRTALEGAQYAKKLGMKTILNPAPASIEPLGSLDFIDVIIPNEVEAKCLAGFAPSDDIPSIKLATKIKEIYHVGIVVITLGSKGIFGFDGKDSWEIAPLPVKAIDTIGAGDVFIGSFALALLKGKSLPEAMTWGNYAAAFSVTKRGSIDSFPTKQDLEDFIKMFAPEAR